MCIRDRFRRDRIRGLCCRDIDGQLTVIVEPRDTELETELIVIHELVHALHQQHPDLLGRLGPSGGFEIPSTLVATYEAIAQFVTFAYLAEQPAEERAVVAPVFPIVPDDMVDEVGIVASAYMNFAYSTAPLLAEEVYLQRGAEGLSDLLGQPATTTEHFVFPERWLADEDRVSQDPPDRPTGSAFLTEGRLGVAVLLWMLGPDSEPLLESWTGDRYTLYRSSADATCLSAVIELDNEVAADELVERLADATSFVVGRSEDRRVVFDTCGSVVG